MKIQDWFENWGLSGLKLSTGFLQMEWQPQPDEQQAAWELYVELLTRVTTQALPDADGDEQTALTSVYELFTVTRELLKQRGRKAQTFSKVAIVVLNQKIRPFTARWHRLGVGGAFDDPEQCRAFRAELKTLQHTLRGYAGLLAEVAGVEDFQELAQGPLEAL